MKLFAIIFAAVLAASAAVFAYQKHDTTKQLEHDENVRTTLSAFETYDLVLYGRNARPSADAFMLADSWLTRGEIIMESGRTTPRQKNEIDNAMRNLRISIDLAKENLAKGK